MVTMFEDESDRNDCKSVLLILWSVNIEQGLTDGEGKETRDEREGTLGKQFISSAHSTGRTQTIIKPSSPGVKLSSVSQAVSLRLASE
jgi:hypothetical protein